MAHDPEVARLREAVDAVVSTALEEGATTASAVVDLVLSQHEELCRSVAPALIRQAVASMARQRIRRAEALGSSDSGRQLALPTILRERDMPSVIIVPDAEAGENRWVALRHATWNDIAAYERMLGEQIDADRARRKVIGELLQFVRPEMEHAPGKTLAEALEEKATRQSARAGRHAEEGAGEAHP